ncbi:hypothetical protein LTR85_010524 [Meristemomyces frigidus]|nr:hypothetical protein LTR85_010524 [Meristemomyces frigidus]
MSGQQQGGEDYLDKAIDAIEKKAGLDPAKYRAQNEKWSDKARALFEKWTGKKVPEKYSN